nr:hypothetical protein [Mycoplasmopsis bovis]
MNIKVPKTHNVGSDKRCKLSVENPALRVDITINNSDQVLYALFP